MTQNCLFLAPAGADETGDLVRATGEAAGAECLFWRCGPADGRQAGLLEQLVGADRVVADLSSNDPGVLYALGVAHGFGRPSVIITNGSETLLPEGVIGSPVVDRSAYPERDQRVEAIRLALRSARSPLPDAIRSELRRLLIPPLADLFDPSTIDEAVRHHLEERRIVTANDLSRLDLDELAADPAINRHALRAFVRLLARSERYPKPEALQQFVIKRGIFL